MATAFRWVAGWNMPGCLPEMEPVGFVHWDEARDYLVTELALLADDPDGDGVIFEQCTTAIEELNQQASVGCGFGTEVDGYVYWLEGMPDFATA